MPMKKEVLSRAAKRNMFLSPEALEMVMSNSDPVAFVDTVLKSLSQNEMFVTKEDVEKCLQGEVVFETAPEFTVPVKFSGEINVLNDSDITGNSTCVGTIDDFFKLFQNRYAVLKKIIERRSDFGPARKINVAVSKGGEVRVIGIINEKKVTTNGHVLLTIEDDGGEHSTCKVLIGKDSSEINTVLVTDEVIGVTGEFKKTQAKEQPILIASKIVKPDIPNSNVWVPSDSKSKVGILSDIHIGSQTFMENYWKKMILWLKENAAKENLNYLILPGDVVDGIGIFPGQIDELSITDIYKQYETLAEYLKEIPDGIKIAIHPGNHDACRPAEPQPALNKVFTKSFDSNIMMLGNPVFLEIEKRKILTYHGRSIDDWISSVQQLTYENPIAVMQEMIKSRHLAPIYGQKTALAPERKDYLLIQTIPDIMITGHVHNIGCKNYKGVRMINASTWQNQTEYQKMHNFNPVPGIMPMVHLGNGAVELKDFSK